jgi:uncharacterized protein YdhG (YjbR/CyaY superfamily)
MSYTSHEAYFAAAPAQTRALLERIQAEVEAQVPNATRSIRYNMPAFSLQRSFFYFGAFQKHIGVYPPLTKHPALILETAPYRNPKGSLLFSLTEPLPLALIGRVAAALAVEYTA